MKIEEYRYAAIIATAIIMLEMIDHFGHVLFDQDMDMLGNLATKSLKLLMLSIVTRKKQKIPKYLFKLFNNALQGARRRTIRAVSMILTTTHTCKALNTVASRTSLTTMSSIKTPKNAEMSTKISCTTISYID